VQGSSGNPNGRPVGSKNKFTTLKSTFIHAFEEIGGVDNLAEWTRCNQAEFYKMMTRLMPRGIHAFVKIRRQLSKEEIITKASIKVKKERTICSL
jgi:hypothetical protein